MPLYEFKCLTCGPIEVWRPMAQSSDPLACEGCDQPAQRVFAPPTLLSSGLSKVRSSPEPRLVQRTVDRPIEQPRVQQPTGGRPWMISH
ncbi:MAG: zinc ribbon domain-containing protein [Synechococcaceae cyanobacterium SM2_3_2]|nr:zinc ribbon domain-containing protein [Synechococcaceae cyanobacterium SM2_3_2]